ncbi:MAG: glycosyltransferase family 4 protein [Gammaproteobacteria bacterium]|nr:MAG: glycosyltransferase family 4 protein [Gammaproteobacteria bacterium]
MRIAQVAPLIESVPPRQYGGTERVVAYLTDELVRQGHDVTLFATEDSHTRARLVPCAPGALRLEPRCRDPLPHYMYMLDELRRRARQFDIVHFHIDYLHYPLMRALGLPHVTTLHGRQDFWDLARLYAAFPDMPLVSISNAQRAPVPDANWVGTVYHGLPPDLYEFSPDGGDYLVFLGRICADKGIDRAIEIATRAGRELLIAAKVDKADREYYEACVRPLLKRPNIRYIGEVDDREKGELLGGALGLLFPIDWPEPFGLAMIESLACGTPVVARPCGSVPELIRDGLSGRIVDGIDDAVAAVDSLRALDRAAARREFEERFSAERMAAEYLAIYRLLLDDRTPLSSAA